MLIYNHNKELIGIDDETLHHLGYKTLATFLESYSDVAELFVKKPGYIHNFQNFPWIDFVLHADAEDTKAIIQTDSKHFSCNIDITPIYLNDAPDQEGYVVYLKHIKSLSGEAPAFVRETAPVEEPMQADFTEEITSPLAAVDSVEPTVLAEPDTFDIPEMPPIDLPDLNADGSLDEPPMFAPQSIEEEIPPVDKEERPMLGDYINKDEATYLNNLKTDKNYQYDPHIAADELGLPVELIEEFIGDFIQQAHEFKDSLFDAALKEDFDEVHILSHKLKGVAANLRIEDAFEVLSIINNSTDQTEIEANLKQFYRIIAKMEGKDVPEFTELEPESNFETPLDDHQDDDIYDIGMLLDDTPLSAPSDADESPMIDLPTETFETPVAEESPETFELPRTEETPETLETPFTEETDETSRTEESPEPFNLDIIPENERHLVQEAAENEEYTHIGGNIEKDADLVAASNVETLHYDVTKASNEIGLKENFVKELLHEFATDAKTKKAALLSAIDNEDFLKVQSIAFEFKGLADNLRIEQVSDTLKKLLRSDDKTVAKHEAERLYSMLEQL